MEHETDQTDVRTKAQALLDGALKCVQVAALAAALIPLGAVVTTPKDAVAGLSLTCSPFSKHCTDGGFNLHVSGGGSTNENPEWSGPNVSKTFFEAVGNTGGAYLYVEQGVRQALDQTGAIGTAADGVANNTLFLMYDYVKGTTPNQNSFFDVFFAVERTGDDYLVRITGNSFQAFEKESGEVSPLNPDGSFDVTDPVWEPVSQAEASSFHGAVGFGLSPNDTVNSHAMAEFELSFDNTSFPSSDGTCAGPNGQPSGFYDPCPAFWSASNKGSLPTDPPISSGIFTLNADGTTTVVPVFAANGGPAQQPQDVVPAAVPEPSTLLLMGTGLLGFLASVWRRKRRS